MKRNDPQRERVNVTVDSFFAHRRNHTAGAPDPHCQWCEPWISDNQRYEDGVIYRPPGGEAA